MFRTNKNDAIEYNPPYVQSDFTCNLTLCAIRLYVQSVQSGSDNSKYAIL